MKEPNEIDRLFQDGLDGFTLTPDTSVKEHIDRAIASRKKRRRFLFLLFPVLFALTGFAAITFYDRKEQETEISTKSTALAQQTGHSAFHENAFPNPPTSSISAKKDLPGEPSTSSASSSSLVRPAARHKSTPTIPLKHQAVSSGEPKNSETGFKNPEPSIGFTAEEAPIHSREPETDNAIQPQPDHTLAAISDSSSTSSSAPAEILKTTDSDNKSGKWSLSLLTYWEGEKRRNPEFGSQAFTDLQRENAGIHASTYYGKVEINRKLSLRSEILTGIGFRSSEMVQYGNLEKIKITIDGTSSGVPQPDQDPDTIRRSEKQSFHVNSLVLPIGFGYSIPIGTKLRIRLSAGTEFAYGHVSGKFTHPDLSAPKFRPFGCSVWARPELAYSSGRNEWFGFGTWNQSLSQQLKWNIEVPRNAAFGVGIGWRIRL